VQALEFWKTVVADKVGLLERLLGLLRDHGIRYCVVGGQAVNAYADPVVSIDLYLVMAVDQRGRAEGLLRQAFTVEHFPPSLNGSLPGSRLRVQVQTDPRYAPFVERAELRDVMDLRLPVARIEDVLQGKIWAVMDPERRASKRQKDLADIARLLEARPALREQVPSEVLSMLL